MRVTVIGCGRIGAYVARNLAARGHDVCVIDQEPRSLRRLGADFPGRTVIGTGFDESVLEAAGVAKTDAVAVLTNLDATNFMVAHAVRDLFGVDRVAVRVNDPEFTDVFKELGLQVIDVPAAVLDAVQGVFRDR